MPRLFPPVSYWKVLPEGFFWNFFLGWKDAAEEALGLGSATAAGLV